MAVGSWTGLASWLVSGALAAAALPAFAQDEPERSCVGKVRLHGPIWDLAAQGLEPGLDVVLDTIAQTAARLCLAEFSFIAKYREGKCWLAAANNLDDEHIAYIARNPVALDRSSITGRVALERHTVHVADVLADPEYAKLEWQRVGKQRTVLGVPLLREGALVGVIILARTSVNRFTDKQIELVTTFADQAVIAIENARLFEELERRTTDLSEALSQQTALGEVLRVIASVPTDVQLVLDTLAQSSLRLCAANQVVVYRLEGGLLRRAQGFAW